MPETANPLVSVIIPFFNEERFLAEAIDSVLAQTYPHWELILFDDGSSDASVSIAQEYEIAQPHRIRYIDHPNHANKGVSACRNAAVAQARGELLAFLDADDVWLPEKLADQVGIMLKNPDAQLLCEAAEYWYYADEHTENVIIQVGKERDRVFYPPQLVFQLYPLSEGQAPCPSGLMVRKAAVHRQGGFEEHFTGRNQMYEDQGFLAKMYLNEPVFISSLCHHRYRQRQGSLVQKVRAEGSYKLVRLYFLEWLEKYITQKKLQYPEVDKLLARSLEPFRHPYRFFARRVLRKIKKTFGQ